MSVSLNNVIYICISVVYIKEEPEDLAFEEVEPDVDLLINDSLRNKESNNFFLINDSISELHLKKESAQDDLVSRQKLL